MFYLMLGYIILSLTSSHLYLYSTTISTFNTLNATVFITPNNITIIYPNGTELQIIPGFEILKTTGLYQGASYFFNSINITRFVLSNESYFINTPFNTFFIQENNTTAIGYINNTKLQISGTVLGMYGDELAIKGNKSLTIINILDFLGLSTQQEEVYNVSVPNNIVMFIGDNTFLLSNGSFYHVTASLQIYNPPEKLNYLIFSLPFIPLVSIVLKKYIIK